MPVAVPRYTVDDLDSFPDDGQRYELLDGILLIPGDALVWAPRALPGVIVAIPKADLFR